MNSASERLLTHFTYGHLPEPLRAVSKACADLAIAMAEGLDSTDPIAGAEVTTGLRRVLEAKDCFVRAKLQLTRPAASGGE
jgi:hypothetical protein